MPQRNVDPRMQELERRLSEQDDARRKMEEKTRELEHQLKEEHEKLIMQSLKSKEEETLSVRVDQQLREMQEKLRREKYEQELQDSRGKAENQLKDLERRIGEERETWMTALKNQLKEREMVEQEVEANLTRRIRELEQRYQEEKNQWLLSIKQKEEEINGERHRFELELEKLQETIEDTEEQQKALKDTHAREQHALDMQRQAEFRALQAQYETQMRETGSWKAQIALVQSQLQQVDVQHQQDRGRLEKQLREREEELKREFAQRDHERTAYWEGVIHQIKGEKEMSRTTLARREEEISRLGIEIADLKRKFDVERSEQQTSHNDEMSQLQTENSELKRKSEQERSEWQVAIEKAKRFAREEALRDLPQIFEDRLKAIQAQLAKAGENHKSLQSKFDVEHRRWEQQKSTMIQAQQDLEAEKSHLLSELHQLKTDFEKQTKELFNHIADSQMKEAAAREELVHMTQAARDRETAWSDEKDRFNASLAEKGREMDDQERKLKQLDEEIVQLKSQSGERIEDQEQKLRLFEEEFTRMKNQSEDLTRQVQEGHAKEELWKTSQAQLTAAFHNVQNELVKLQNERVGSESAWAEKEQKWMQAKTDWENSAQEWEKTKAEFAAAKSSFESAKANWEKIKNQPPAPVVTPEVQKTFAAIRQQMQELRSLCASLRPAA